MNPLYRTQYIYTTKTKKKVNDAWVRLRRQPECLKLDLKKKKTHSWLHLGAIFAKIKLRYFNRGWYNFLFVKYVYVIMI